MELGTKASRLAFYKKRISYYVECYEINKKYTDFDHLKNLAKSHLKSAMLYYSLHKQLSEEPSDVQSNP